MRREAAGLGVIALMLSSCDVFKGPAVYNLSEADAVVSWVDTSGLRKELTLPPCGGGLLHAAPDGSGPISHLQIAMPGGRVFEIRPDTVGNLMHLEKVAVVQPDGVTYYDTLGESGIDACER